MAIQDEAIPLTQSEILTEVRKCQERSINRIVKEMEKLMDENNLIDQEPDIEEIKVSEA